MAADIRQFRRRKVKKPLITLFAENPDLLKGVQEVLQDAIHKGLIFEDDPEIQEILNAEKLWPELIMAQSTSGGASPARSPSQILGTNVREFGLNRKKRPVGVGS